MFFATLMFLAFLNKLNACPVMDLVAQFARGGGGRDIIDEVETKIYGVKNLFYDGAEGPRKKF